MVSIAAIPNRMQGTSVQTDKFPDKLPIGTTTTTTPDDAQQLDAWQQELAQNWTSGGYAQMPNAVRTSTLSPKAKLVYEQLLSYMWFHKDHCWPGQQELADKTGYSTRTIIRALQELYDRGYIEVERRGLGDTNRYYLNPLSFAQSFRPISGPRTEYRMPHQNVFQAHNPLLHQSIDAVVRRPVEPYYPEVTKCHTGSDKMADTQMPECHTNYTKPNLSESESHQIDSRSGSAAGRLGVKGCSPTTIRRDKTSGTQNRNGDQERNQNETKSVPTEGNGGAARAEDVQTAGRKKHGNGERPPALPIYIEESLKPISSQFCDQASESSKTSVAWSYAEMRQRGGDEYAFSMVMDQVKDITISMTPRIKARNPDGSIAQMRYFLSTLEKTVDAWCKQYDEAVVQQQTESVAQQNTLQVNESESTVQEEVQDGRSVPGDSLRSDNAEHVAQEEQQFTPTSIAEPAAIQNPEPVSPVEQNQSELEQIATEPNPVEPITAELEQITVPEPMLAADPAPGWTHSTATWWADRLCGYLGYDQHESAVWPIRGSDRYGFVIRENRPGSTWEQFYSKGQATARWQQQADQWKKPSRKM